MMHCRYCGVAIRTASGSPAQMHGCRPGLRYADGRIICDRCHRHAIKHEHQLQAIRRHVTDSFADWRLHINWASLPVELLQLPQLRLPGLSSQVVGWAQSTISDRKQVSSRVAILYGMPAAIAVETLAHEAGHVWCREHHIEFKPDRQDEEGFCNVLGCMALERLGPQHDAPERIKNMFSNPDPIYGDKFREQWQRLSQRGWERYRADVTAQGRY